MWREKTEGEEWELGEHFVSSWPQFALESSHHYQFAKEPFLYNMKEQDITVSLFYLDGHSRSVPDFINTGSAILGHLYKHYSCNTLICIVSCLTQPFFFFDICMLSNLAGTVLCLFSRQCPNLTYLKIESCVAPGDHITTNFLTYTLSWGQSSQHQLYQHNELDN